MKKIIIISLAVIILAALSFVFFVKYSPLFKCDPNQKNSACNWQLIMDKKDPNLCKKISDKTEQKNCLDMLDFYVKKASPAITACDSLSEYKTSCIADKAIDAAETSASSTVCLNLNQSDQASCLNYYYLGAAIKNRDVKLCDYISDSQRKNDCRTAVSRIKIK